VLSLQGPKHVLKSVAYHVGLAFPELPRGFLKFAGQEQEEDYRRKASASSPTRLVDQDQASSRRDQTACF
jgi:hypothetical protein